MNNKKNLHKLIKKIYKVDVVTESMEQNFFGIFQDLTENEEKVVRLRFGLGDDKLKTYREIGEALNLSTPRIYEINKKALLKLRHPVRRRKVLGNNL